VEDLEAFVLETLQAITDKSADNGAEEALQCDEETGVIIDRRRRRDEDAGNGTNQRRKKEREPSDADGLAGATLSGSLNADTRDLSGLINAVAGTKIARREIACRFEPDRLHHIQAY
jgi:hypothetical protein